MAGQSVWIPQNILESENDEEVNGFMMSLYTEAKSMDDSKSTVSDMSHMSLCSKCSSSLKSVLPNASHRNSGANTPIPFLDPTERKASAESAESSGQLLLIQQTLKSLVNEFSNLREGHDSVASAMKRLKVHNLIEDEKLMVDKEIQIDQADFTVSVETETDSDEKTFVNQETQYLADSDAVVERDSQTDISGDVDKRSDVCNAAKTTIDSVSTFVQTVLQQDDKKSAKILLSSERNLLLNNGVFSSKDPGISQVNWMIYNLLNVNVADIDIVQLQCIANFLLKSNQIITSKEIYNSPAQKKMYTAQLLQNVLATLIELHKLNFTTSVLTDQLNGLYEAANEAEVSLNFLCGYREMGFYFELISASINVSSAVIVINYLRILLEKNHAGSLAFVQAGGLEILPQYLIMTDQNIQGERSIFPSKESDIAISRLFLLLTSRVEVKMFMTSDLFLNRILSATFRDTTYYSNGYLVSTLEYVFNLLYNNDGTPTPDSSYFSRCEVAKKWTELMLNHLPNLKSSRGTIYAYDSSKLSPSNSYYIQLAGSQDSDVQLYACFCILARCASYTESYKDDELKQSLQKLETTERTSTVANRVIKHIREMMNARITELNQWSRISEPRQPSIDFW